MFEAIEETVLTVSIIVPFETIFLYEYLKLVAEGLLSMMLLLVCDLGGNLIGM